MAWLLSNGSLYKSVIPKKLQAQEVYLLQELLSYMQGLLCLVWGKKCSPLKIFYLQSCSKDANIQFFKAFFKVHFMWLQLYIHLSHHRIWCSQRFKYSPLTLSDIFLFTLLLTFLRSLSPLPAERKFASPSKISWWLRKIFNPVDGLDSTFSCQSPFN